MTDPSEPAAPRRRGRKRDPGRTGALLEAALEQLFEVGYDSFRVQDVARRAGSGTGAIYRRWPSKEALVAAAIRNMKHTPLPVTDDPVADIRVLVRRECARHARAPDRVPGLISAMRADRGIEEAVRTGYGHGELRAAIARVVGPEHPQLGLLSEIAAGVSLLRAAFAPQTLEPDTMADGIIALILAAAPGADAG